MPTEYAIGFRHSAGNLHIKLSGAFSGNCAWELLKTIRWQYAGSGRIFIDTARLDSVLADGVALFKTHLGAKRMPPDWLYFKGKKGFQIAPEGSRVIMRAEGRGQKANRPSPLWKRVRLAKPKRHHCGSVDMLEDKMAEMGGQATVDGLKIDGDPADFEDEIVAWAGAVADSLG
jgi:hypothetical protein